MNVRVREEATCCCATRIHHHARKSLTNYSLTISLSLQSPEDALVWSIQSRSLVNPHRANNMLALITWSRAVKINRKLFLSCRF